MSDREPTPLPVLPFTEPGKRQLMRQVVQFSRALHAAGLPVNPAGLIDLGRCLRFVDIGNRADFHAAARATLVSSQADIPVFEDIFDAFWSAPGGIHEPRRERKKPEEGPQSSEDPEPAGQMLQQAEENEPDSEREGGEETVAWSTAEALAHKDFRHMSDQEMEQARRLIASLIELLARKTSRRMSPSHRRGDLDLRRMLRVNALRGSDGTEFRFRRKRIKRTRLLLLCDVSGSMERYSRFLIQFIYALRQQLAHIDVAVFSTRMTVITDLLRWQSVERSLQDVSERASDWGGGTDIGSCLRSFNDHFSADMHRSHSVAIILSDGWDRGDADVMREEMQRLNQQVHRVLWLNPLLGHDEYQPLCQGMRTALPFIDDFLPAHNLASLADLLQHLRTVWH